MSFIDVPLFPLSDDAGDALNPGLGDPTPEWEIAKLTRTQREERVTRLVEQANRIYRMGVDLAEGREITASAILFHGPRPCDASGRHTRDPRQHRDRD
jgi:hypothetical protein